MKRQGQSNVSHAFGNALDFDLNFFFGGLHLHPCHRILPVQDDPIIEPPRGNMFEMTYISENRTDNFVGSVAHCCSTDMRNFGHTVLYDGMVVR
jgi:hypothetical protein